MSKLQSTSTPQNENKLYELKKSKIFIIFKDDEYILFVLNGEQHQQYKNFGITQKLVNLDGKESWEEVNHIHIDKYHIMEEVKFPLTAPANKYGVMVLFEDDLVKIMRLEGNRLIRDWKNKTLTEFTFIDEKNSKFVEWHEALNLDEYIWDWKEDSFIHPDTGYKITSKRLEDLLGSNYRAIIKNWSVEKGEIVGRG